MNSRRRRAAFTLVEALVSTVVASLLGGIVYVVAVEAVTSFARNVSINRSYTEARMTLDRIAQTVGSAGHTPILIDANGATTANSPAAGIRFYRANPASSYKVATGSTGPYSSNKSVDIQLVTGQTLPAAKDLAVIPTLGYQGTINSVVANGSNYTLNFTNTLVTDCSPTPTAVTSLVGLYIQTYTQVSYVVVGNQLRYYPQAKSVAVDGTAFSSTANYQVLVSLVSSAVGPNGNAAATLTPFSIVNSPTVQVQLYAENPDYNNRTAGRPNSVNAANTYTFMQCSLGARSPVLLRSPY